MRILHLVSYPIFSGPLPPTVGLALAQRALGHTVGLAYDVKRGAFNDYEEAAAPAVEGLGLAPPVSLTLSTKSSPAEYVRDLRRLRKLLRGGGLDVLHVHLSHDHGLAALAGAARGVARVRTFHAERSLSPRFGQAWLTRRAEGWIVRSAAHRPTLLTGFGVAEQRVRFIPGGIDARRFRPVGGNERAAARARLGIPQRDPVLAHVALIAGRGQEELVEAARRLGTAAPRLLFVGRGEAEQALRRLVAAAGLGERVHFAGYLQGDALLDAYAAADAAFAAQPGNDASCRAALEAMASSLPVIAVRAGALAELVDDAVGYPVAAREPGAIAAAVSEWMRDAAARERGACGRGRVVEERSFAREAARTLELYEAARRGS